MAHTHIYQQLVHLHQLMQNNNLNSMADDSYFALILLKKMTRTTMMMQMETRKENTLQLETNLTREKKQNMIEATTTPRCSPRLNQTTKKRSKRFMQEQAMALSQRVVSS